MRSFFCKKKSMNLARILLLLTVFFIFSVGFSRAQDTDDIVNWNDITFTLPLWKKNEIEKLSISFTGVLRIGRNLKRPIDERGGVSLNYRINKYFSTNFGYLYRRSRPTERPAQFEHRLIFALTAEKKFEHITLRNRLMTMRQIRHSNSDLTVQRNRLQISFPIRKKKVEILAPFVTDEIYYNFHTKKLFRNDLFIGVTKKFNNKLSADFFYIKQNISSGQIKETDGFGISLRVKLKN